MSALPAPAVPRLHQSIAHVLISRSPLHAWQQHPELGGEPREPSAAMTDGSLLDAMLLGCGPEVVVIDPSDYPSKPKRKGEEGTVPNGWTNDAIREARDQVIVEGKLPILLDDHAALLETVAVLRLKMERKGVRLTGQSQVTVKWTSPNADVPCEGRLDHLILDEHSALIYDLKKTRNASRDAITRSMVDYGCDIQRAAYVEAIETLYPHLAGRVRMRFLFCETEVPCVSVAEPTGTMRALGEHKWRRACLKWDECLRSGTWPDYSDDVMLIEAKPYQLTDEVGEGDDNGISFK